VPPVESWRGTRPIQAAKSRPDLKTVGSDTVAAIAVAPMTPTPGMVSPARLVRTMLHLDPLLDRPDHRLHSLKLRRGR
jgi:hypothetical protein